MHLQVDLVWICVERIVDLLLEGFVILEGFGVDEDGTCSLHSIVSYRIEVAFSIGQERYFSRTKANLQIPRRLRLWTLKLFTDLHKRHVVLLQIYLTSNGHEGHHLNINLSVDSDSNCTLLLVYFVLQLHVVFHLVEGPSV